MKVLAVIPARGGSKGVPGKNIVPVGGRPLIAWTIDAARSAGVLDRVVVSTDAEPIAEVARRFGAEVPFLRPPELATDQTAGVLPILHAVQWLADHERYEVDAVVCLQPTSPLRTGQDIAAAIELFDRTHADSVVSVSPVETHPYWMKRVASDCRLSDWAEAPAIPRRQELSEVYGLNGAIYLARKNVLLSHRDWYTSRTYAYIMPPERALDIDTAWHVRLADILLRQGGDAAHSRS